LNAGEGVVARNIASCGSLLNVLLAALVVALAGCASGPKYAEVKRAIPELDPEMGRIFFYRSSAIGAAIQPNILLNDQVVGEMVPLGFFFVDRRPGVYEAAAKTESEARVRIQLEANQTRFVRGSITLGIMVGRPQLELVDAANAFLEIQDLSYTGASALGAAGTPAASPPAGEAAASQGGSNLRELEGLLPAEKKP
jgi:hypothetical protein